MHYIVLEDLKKVKYHFSSEGWAYWSVRKEESQISEPYSLGEKSRATASLRA